MLKLSTNILDTQKLKVKKFGKKSVEVRILSKKFGGGGKYTSSPQNKVKKNEYFVRKLQNLWRHHKDCCIMEVILLLFCLES